MLRRRISDYREKFLRGGNSREDSYLATINALAYAIETRDPNTRGHSERVATYSVWLAEYIHLSRNRMKIMQVSCRLHDVGKIAVADQILLKAGKLSFGERAQIELHPVYGVEILGDLKFISKGMPFILHHHERYDGKGYPDGLKKDEIPLEARIISIADAFDAMTSDRPYRPALSMEQTMEEFKKNSGTQFDPNLVKVFFKLVEVTSQNIRCMRAA